MSNGSSAALEAGATIYGWLRTAAVCGLLAMGTGCDQFGLVEVSDRFRLDMRYATTNNFTGHRLYWEGRCYLRPGTAKKLRAAEKELRAAGLQLRLLDCYRPLSVQRQMWSLVPDAQYVADPKEGSRHNRGAAVDVTLTRIADGTELFMPTPFDDFTAKAHRDAVDLTAEQIANRDQLESVMERNGFVGLPTEWWHFDDSDWQRYPVLEVDFRKLRGFHRSFAN